MKLQDIYRQDKLVISFELFPPKKWSGVASLFEHFNELVKCQPAYITCTYGAGGGSRDKTLDVLKLVRGDYPDVPMASHLTCVGSTPDELRDYIDRAIEVGIEHIVALRGDPPSGESDFKPVPGGFRYANELVAMIKEEYPQLGVIVGGYPETHPEAPDSEADITNLKRKVDAGADVITTQLFYDNEDFYRFRDRCEKAGIDVPIVPGVLPVLSLGQIKRIAKMCGARLPDRLRRRLEAHGEDNEGQFAVGLYYAARQVEDLVDNGVPGIHFYVLNRSRSAALICRALTLSSVTKSIQPTPAAP